jgi:hypothetical protein
MTINYITGKIPVKHFFWRIPAKNNEIKIFVHDNNYHFMMWSSVNLVPKITREEVVDSVKHLRSKFSYQPFYYADEGGIK